MIGSHRWLVVTALDKVNLLYFYHHRKFYWIALLQMVPRQCEWYASCAKWGHRHRCHKKGSSEQTLAMIFRELSLGRVLTNRFEWYSLTGKTFSTEGMNRNVLLARILIIILVPSLDYIWFACYLWNLSRLFNILRSLFSHHQRGNSNGILPYKSVMRINTNGK